MMNKTFKFPNNSLHAIIAAITTIGAVGIALGMGTQLISLLMTEKGFSNSIIGYSGAIGGVATIIAATLAARIALYLGVVESMLLMMVFGSLSFLGFYFFESIWIWFILRFTLHFAMTIIFILSEFWINNASPPQRRSLIISIYAITLGLGFILGPMLLEKIGTQDFIPFGTGCLLIIIAIIPLLSAWKLSPKFQSKENTTFFSHIFRVPTSTMAALIYGAIQMGTLTLITPFILSIGYNKNESIHFMEILALGNILLLIPISFISDYLKDKRYSLMGCAILGLIGTLIIPRIAEHQLILMIDLFLLGGIPAGLYTIGLAQLGTYLKGQELAAANSAFIFCYGIGILIGPAIIGQIMDMFKPFGFSLAIACFFSLYIILVLIQLIRKSNNS
ncbi:MULTISPECIES: MFS transporter [unclassified Bartonella]|uniref:MFS transporter n=1 Tax=unclassified Bartonella TaxID=2645622 RepID=UPI0009998F64|nr:MULTISPECIES: MFS transporter [unclassified Bartonella]AQX28052.1 Cyanate permease [Bartonella sp. JB15]AQX29327.1 Cyanate permease [Bartonella sp. JB63]